MTEMWKPIPGFDGYEVSDAGNVRSYRKRGGGAFHDTPHTLKPSTDPNGYRGVNLGRSYWKRTGYLVLLAFIGKRPDGLEVCHNNSNPGDDRLENLRWDTHEGNMADMKAITEKWVVEMREKRAAGASIAELAFLYDKRPCYVDRVCSGKCHPDKNGPLTRFQLFPGQVVEILQRREQGETLKSIGERYDKSVSAISLIVNGKRHAHIYEQFHAGGSV